MSRHGYDGVPHEVMMAFRKGFAWLVILLGGLGVLASVSAIAGVWAFSERAQGSVDQVVGKVTGFTERIRSRTEEAAAWAGEASLQVAALEERLQRRRSEHLGLDEEELAEAEEQLRIFVQRARDWAAVAESTQSFVELFGDLVNSLGAIAGAVSREEIGVALAEGVDELQGAALALKRLSQTLDAVRVARDGGRQALIPLVQRCGVSLAELEQSILGFSEDVARVEASAQDLGSEINRRVLVAVIVVTILLVWQACAQACLVAWGRRLARGKGLPSSSQR